MEILGLKLSKEEFFIAQNITCCICWELTGLLINTSVSADTLLRSLPVQTHFLACFKTKTQREQATDGMWLFSSKDYKVQHQIKLSGV